MKPYRPANPAIWGAVLAVIVALLVIIGQATGQPPSDSALLQTPMKAAGAAFGFGFAVALFRNWLNERNRREP